MNSEIFTEKHILIAGCGGLGSNCAMLLVRAGVGELTLIDFDRVELGNLNRQFFFRNQIGLRKTEALAQNLRQINPNVTLNLFSEKITVDNFPLFFTVRPDAVLECLDNPETKAFWCGLIQRELPQIPLVAASGIGGFSPEMAIRRLAGNFFLVGDGDETTEKSELFSARVMLAATKQVALLAEWFAKTGK